MGLAGGAAIELPGLLAGKFLPILSFLTTEAGKEPLRMVWLPQDQQETLSIKCHQQCFSWMWSGGQMATPETSWVKAGQEHGWEPTNWGAREPLAPRTPGEA